MIKSPRLALPANTHISHLHKGSKSNELCHKPTYPSRLLGTHSAQASLPSSRLARKYPPVSPVLHGFIFTRALVPTSRCYYSIQMPAHSSTRACASPEAQRILASPCFPASLLYWRGRGSDIFAACKCWLVTSSSFLPTRRVHKGKPHLLS